MDETPVCLGAARSLQMRGRYGSGQAAGPPRYSKRRQHSTRQVDSVGRRTDIGERRSAHRGVTALAVQLYQAVPGSATVRVLVREADGRPVTSAGTEERPYVCTCDCGGDGVNERGVPRAAAVGIGAERAEAAVDTYIAAWNEPDADRRRQLLAQVMSADALYVDPAKQIGTRAALVQGDRRGDD